MLERRQIPHEVVMQLNREDTFTADMKYVAMNVRYELEYLWRLMTERQPTHLVNQVIRVIVNLAMIPCVIVWFGTIILPYFVWNVPKRTYRMLKKAVRD